MEDGSRKLEAGSEKTEDDASLINTHPKQITAEPIVEPVVIEAPVVALPAVSRPTTDNQQPTTEQKISSLSLSSIKAKKDRIEATNDAIADAEEEMKRRRNDTRRMEK